MPRVYRIFLVILFLGFAIKGSHATGISPDEVIGVFHDVLLNVMKKANLTTPKERYLHLESACDKAFAFDFMIKLASGTSWRKADKHQQIELAKAFRRMTIATYAYRFKNYSGQFFKTIKTLAGMRKTHLVYTQIITPGSKNQNKSVQLTYVTRKFSTGWKIVDILLEGGISELSVRHSEYRTILRTNGARKLAELLNRKADQLISN